MIKLGHMTRIIAIATICLMAACDVGSVLAHEGSGDDGSGTDGGSTVSGSDCDPLVTPETQTGHHAANGMPGDAGATAITPHEGCMGQAGCHNVALSPTPGDIWDYGGEAFQDSAGTIPYAGATILLGTVSASPIYVKLEVNQNGFFYLPNGTSFPTPGTMPVQTWMCVGATKVEMSGTIAAGGGNCSSGAACHGATADTGGFVFMAP